MKTIKDLSEAWGKYPKFYEWLETNFLNSNSLLPFQPFVSITPYKKRYEEWDGKKAMVQLYIPSLQSEEIKALAECKEFAIANAHIFDGKHCLYLVFYLNDQTK